MSHIKLGFHMSVVSQPLNIAVLTISDTRTLENDKSGDYLKEALTSVGHKLYDRDLVKDPRSISNESRSNSKVWTCHS